jgi:hypothetical protein
MAAYATDGLKQILRRMIGEDQAEQLADDWATRRPRAVKNVNRLLESAGLTIDAIQAETLVMQLEAIERIERLEATAEHRRNAILHEIERHRASFASSLRRATDQVGDAAVDVMMPAKP